MPEFSLRLTLAMAHFLWQGCAIAIVYAAADWLLRRRTANTRYVAAVATLVLMAACLPVTIIVCAGIATVDTMLAISAESPGTNRT